MRARRDPGRLDHGLRGVRGQRHHVRAADRGLGIVDGVCTRVQRGEPVGVLGVEGADADLVEVAHEREGLEVMLALHAGADDRERLRVLAREQVGGDRGRRARADRGDVGPVHERAAGAAVRVVEADRRQVARVVGLEDGDDLHGHRTVAQAAGHPEQEGLVGHRQLVAPRRGDLAAGQARRSRRAGHAVEQRARRGRAEPASTAARGRDGLRTCHARRSPGSEAVESRRAVAGWRAMVMGRTVRTRP